MWQRIIREKYKMLKGDWYTRYKGPHGCSVWGGIMNCKSFFKENICFKAAKGDRIQFWKDAWCAGMSLEQTYPSLFKLSGMPEGMISELAKTEGSSVTWDLHFRRRLSDNENEAASLLLSQIESFKISDNPDKWEWKGNKGIFTVKDASDKLMMKRMSENNLGVPAFPKKLIWKKSTPSKVNFFMWTLYRERLATIDRIKKWGSPLANRCVMCGEAEERITHLFIECEVAQRIWRSILGKDLSPSDENIADQLVKMKPPRTLTVEGIIYWEWVIHAVLWQIWLERNRRLFEDTFSPISRVLTNIMYCIHAWGLSLKELEKVKVDDLIFDWESVMFETLG